MTDQMRPETRERAEWLLDSDTRRKHRGSAIGHLRNSDGTTGPSMYRQGLGWFARTWTVGLWDGPDEGRPDVDPVALEPVCSCGWMSEYAIWMEPNTTPVEDRPIPAHRMAGEDRARAWWLAHAVAATHDTPPTSAEATADELDNHLRTLATAQPLAALRLLARITRTARAVEETAVLTGRALSISWDDLAQAADGSPTQLNRRYKPAVDADASSPSDRRHPGYVPDHLVDGDLDYTLTLLPDGMELHLPRPAEELPVPAARPAAETTPHQDDPPTPTLAAALATGSPEQVRLALSEVDDPAAELDAAGATRDPLFAELALVVASTTLARLEPMHISSRLYDATHRVSTLAQLGSTTLGEALDELAAMRADLLKLPDTPAGRAFRAALTAYQQTTSAAGSPDALDQRRQ